MLYQNKLLMFFLGIVLLGISHIAFIMLTSLLSLIPILQNDITLALFFIVFGIGISQLVYVIPLVIGLLFKRQYALMKGVIGGAVITALFNGGCYWYLLNVLESN